MVFHISEISLLFLALGKQRKWVNWIGGEELNEIADYLGRFGFY